MIRITYNNNGKVLKVENHNAKTPVLENQEVLESTDTAADKYHKEPFRSEYKLNLIRTKTKELLKINYIFGLDAGIQKDAEYKTWFEEIINFSESYKNREITETKVSFPVDPEGNQEVIKF